MTYSYGAPTTVPIRPTRRGGVADDKKNRVSDSGGGPDDDDSWTRMAAPTTMMKGLTVSFTALLVQSMP